ncbi:hypothetical protein KOR34_02100 [Posidoniimonas corsicana]|uniref:Uncharacterized protein n=1 Tax=Posidoniimonas corsicana TaxID=1938618 RepID=A0A5C5VBD0_9BACT|nr:hypothetical protein [Posidoniimonas corsicana]TWT35320.1 hypothetical protein KOR34_02100 [Posidoniimonas corsicana]
MPTVTAGTNCWTRAQDAVAAGLASLPAFQSLTETTDAAAAAEKIFLDYWPSAWDGEAITRQQAESFLGGAMVKPTDDHPYRHAIVNGRAMGAGRMQVKIVRLVRKNDEILRDENDRVARNWIGDLVKEFCVWCEVNQGRGWLGTVSVEYGPNHRPRKLQHSAGHVYEAMLSFDWGHPDLRRAGGG